MEYTVEKIEELITEEKEIISITRKEFKEVGQHLRNDFELVSFDKKRSFHVFLRKHIDYLENFSIGLVYLPVDRASIHLIRFNGNHGETVENVLMPHAHRDFHIHKITPELIEEEINDPKKVSITEKYASYEQAFRYFCKYTNIVNASKYFPEIDQPNLFED